METADVAAHPLFVVVDVLTLTRIIKSVVTGQAPVTLELRNTPGKNTNNPRWYTPTRFPFGRWTRASRGRRKSNDYN